MISGVLAMLLAQAVVLRSWPLALWMGLFFLANYFLLSEERGLERRFGRD